MVSRQRSRTPAAPAEPKQRPSGRQSRQTETLTRGGSGSGSSSGPFLTKDGKVPTVSQKDQNAAQSSSQSVGLLTPFKPGDWARVPPELRDTIKNGQCGSLGTLESVSSLSYACPGFAKMMVAWIWIGTRTLMATRSAERRGPSNPASSTETSRNRLARSTNIAC